MSTLEKSNPHLGILLHKVSTIMQDPAYGQEPKNYEVLASVLKATNFFQQKLQHPINFYDFIEVAKLRLTYEVHRFGSVLLRENENADKFCIILKGSLQKFEPKPEVRLKQVQERHKNQANENKKLRNSSTIANIGEIISDIPNDIPMIPKLQFSQTKRGFLKKMQTVDDIDEFDDLISNNPGSSIPRLRRGGLKLELDKAINIKDSNVSHSQGEIQTERIEINHEGSKSPPKGPRSKNLSLLDEQIKPTFQMKPHLRQFVVMHKEEIQTLYGESKKEEIKEDKPQEKKVETLEEARANREKIKNMADFLQHIVYKDPDFDEICYYKGSIRLHNTGKLRPGDFFGENFLKPMQMKETSSLVVSSEEVHLLVLTRDNYNKILAELHLQAREKAEFFIESFPSFDKLAVEKFSLYFSQTHYKKGEIIYNQDDPVQNLYLLKLGDVRLIKEIDVNKGNTSPSNPFLVNVKRNEKMEFPIACITKNQLFGEELILDKDKREFTAVANSLETVAYFLNLETYSKIQGILEEFLKILKDQTQKRFVWRQQRAVGMLDNHHSNRTHKPAFNNISIDVLGTRNMGSSAGNTMNENEINYGTQTARAKNNYISMEVNKQIAAAKSARNMKTASNDFVPNERTLEIYKKNFSRKIPIYKKDELEQILWKKIEESSNLDNPPMHQSKLEEYSIRRVMKNLSPTRSKSPTTTLPALSSSRDSSKKKKDPGVTRTQYFFNHKRISIITTDESSENESPGKGVLSSSADYIKILPPNLIKSNQKIKKIMETQDLACVAYGFQGQRPENSMQTGPKPDARNSLGNIKMSNNIASLRPQLFRKLQEKKNQNNSPRKLSKGS